MPLEATILILDNSEYMRNGDYVPSRFDAQADAVNTVVQTKLDSNAENTVGILTMAGSGAEVLVTHTKEIGQVLTAVHTASRKLGGTSDIPTALAIAQLALKHRQNKNLRQRVLVFLGSPLTGASADSKGMVKLAKRLKKNNVAVDIVAFGDGIEEGGEEGVLKQFVDAANSSDNSHFLTVPPGAHLLSDALLRSPVLAADIPGAGDFGGDTGGAEGGAGGSGAGGAGFEFGIDPSMDPELAMALRMSMEEETARQAAAAAAAQGTAAAGPSNPTPAATAGAPTTAAATAGTSAVGAGVAAVATGPAASVPADPTDDEEDALLQQALALSQAGGTRGTGDMDVEMNAGGGDGDAEMEGDDDEDEEAQIARAIALSMEEEEEGDGMGTPKKGAS